MTLQRLKDRLPLLPVLEWGETVLHWRRLEELSAMETSLVTAHDVGDYTDVAVVIATYRRTAPLQRAVKSALRQSYDGSIAVVVVDDGGGMARSAVPDDQRVCIIELPHNVGVAGVVRNVGIRLTRSRYLAFLDDDNWWDAHHLSAAVSALENANAGVAYSGLRMVTSDGHPYGDTPERPARALDRARLRRINDVDTSAIIALRTPHVRFSRLPRRRGARNIEDWELIYRLSRTERCVPVPHVTLNYTVNPESFFSVWGAAP